MFPVNPVPTTYASRPFIIGREYPVKLFHYGTAGHFVLQMADPSGLEHRRKLEVALKEYSRCSIRPSVAHDAVAVVVRLTDESDFRRGEIKFYLGGKVLVEIVDEGRNKLLDKFQVYPASKNLLRIPKFVYRCALANIEELGDMEFLFEEPGLTMRVHAVEDGVLQVTCSRDGVDIGLMATIRYREAKFIVSHVTAEPGAELLRINLLPMIGTKFPVRSLRVEGKQVLLELIPLQTVQTKIRESQLIPLGTNVNLGKAVLARYRRGGYYRAEVLEAIGDSGDLKLSYSDLGEVGFVRLDECFEMPVELAEIPCLVKKVNVGDLKEIELSEAQELVLKQSLTDRTVFVTVTADNGTSTDVDIEVQRDHFDLQGKLVSDLLGLAQIPVPELLLVMDRELSAIEVQEYIFGPNIIQDHMTVRRADGQVTILDAERKVIEREMAQTYTRSFTPPPSCLEIGTAVAVRIEQIWSRGVIRSSRAKTLTLELVDLSVGNVTVSKSSVRMLPAYFARRPRTIWTGKKAGGWYGVGPILVSHYRENGETLVLVTQM